MFAAEPLQEQPGKDRGPNGHGGINDGENRATGLSMVALAQDYISVFF